MFIFPWYSLDDEIQITPNEEGNGNADMQRTDHMRYLKVPFAINVMSGGQYQEKQNIQFGGIVDGKKFSSKLEGLGKISGDEMLFPEEWGIKMHQHDYYELMYVLDGEVEQQIESSTYVYRKGEGCFINRNTKHREIFLVYNTWNLRG